MVIEPSPDIGTRMSGDDGRLLFKANVAASETWGC
jgi:hypothetical protein